MPIRRLDLLKAEPGVAHRISVAWVLLPSLEVVQADQIYTAAGHGRVRFANETFSADLIVDDDGFVVDYPEPGHADVGAGSGSGRYGRSEPVVKKAESVARYGARCRPCEATHSFVDVQVRGHRSVAPILRTRQGSMSLMGFGRGWSV